MLGVWIADKIGPGGHSLIIIDGLHQYMPFFSDYQDKLREGSSLFYSFQEGMGTNFLSLWSYYLASPLNLLILLFPYINHYYLLENGVQKMYEQYDRMLEYQNDKKWNRYFAVPPKES